MHSCSLFFDKADLQIHLPHRGICPEKVKWCDSLIRQPEATYFDPIQYETDKVVRKNLGGDKIPQAFFALHFLPNTATEIRFSSKGVIWQRWSRRFWLLDGHCSFLSSGFHDENVLSVHQLLRAFQFDKGIAHLYALWAINKQTLGFVCVFTAHRDPRETVIHEQMLHFPSRGHLAVTSTAKEEGGLTCNFLDSAKNVETFRVQRSNTVIHIPVGHNHRKKPSCLCLSKNLFILLISYPAG